MVASTFPVDDDDPVPAFVRDQVIAMAAQTEDVEWHVLAPHDRRSQTRTMTEHGAFTEHRFRYAWPRRVEALAGRGIMPTLRANPWMYPVLPAFFVGEAIALLRLARRLRPTVIYAHWFTPQGVVAAWVAAAVGARFVFTTHASDVAIWRKIPVVGPRIVRWHASRADAITAVSTRSMARLESFFDRRRWAELEPRASIIPMGVETAEWSGAARERTIVFVGRLAEKKGLQVLLPALAEVKGRLEGWRFVVAGDGPWRQRLERLADELELEVEFPGYVTGAAKRELIETAGVFVVPSVIASDGDAEGLPVSLMEAMAASRVCVATFESGADDLLSDGVDGFLVAERDVTGLGQALVRAAHLDAEAAERVGAAAAARIAALSWAEIARRHLEVVLGDV